MIDSLADTSTKAVYFGQLSAKGLTLSELNCFKGFFTCGLIVKENHEEEDWRLFFHLLIAAGCRAIAIYGTQAHDLERIFDSVVVGLCEKTDLSTALWSSVHPTLDSMIQFALIVDLNDAYTKPVGNLFVLQHGGKSMKQRCGRLISTFRRDE